MWDEMSLQKHIELNKHTGYVIGLTDFGGQISCHRQDIGDHALVFLFHPYLNGWSQTIGTLCQRSNTWSHSCSVTVKSNNLFGELWSVCDQHSVMDPLLTN